MRAVECVTRPCAALEISGAIEEPFEQPANRASNDAALSLFSVARERI
jgi:hypothetical protein